MSERSIKWKTGGGEDGEQLGADSREIILKNKRNYRQNFRKSYR